MIPQRPAQTLGQRDRSIVPGEFLLTAEDFRTIAQTMYSDAGIHMPESKATLVYSRLARRLRALGLESFRSYCELITSSNGVDERQKMLAALTTNVTRFFREPHHFEHLKTRVLPQLLKAAARGECVRIWSAGCSNGQEAYTIALVILSLMPDAGRHDIKILASDIDPNVVEEGRVGVYEAGALADVNPEQRRRFFERPSGDGAGAFSVTDDMRALVTFRELNLFAKWPMKKPFQVVFCRNVAIYFDQEHQSNLWKKFMSVITPGGVLYIGHSERLVGEAAAKFVNDGITTWRLPEGVRA
ncbi:MAG: protein-glutamate O-methyltransferase [Beijerinckiaceae bacterium]|jgi:chemotaxis protein methyltransferase CheR|nr:protein-glutamate O-methyltransferase [Beijerinckiaceae bacterium]